MWLSLLLVEIILEAAFTALIPKSQQYFFNLLGHFSHNIYYGLLFYFFMRFGYDICQAIKPYLQIRYSQILRESKTTALLGSELNQVDNVPQRLQEDIKLMYLNQITVYTEYTISGIIFFVLLIYTKDHPILVGCAILYAIISLALTYLFNPKMIYAERIIQKSEADFRKELSIKNLLEVIGYNIISAKIRLVYQLFTKLQGGLVLVLPYLFLLPAYVNKQLSLGDLIAQSSIFGLIVVNFDILIAVFPLLTQGKASKERVLELTNKKST